MIAQTFFNVGTHVKNNVLYYIYVTSYLHIWKDHGSIKLNVDHHVMHSPTRCNTTKKVMRSETPDSEQVTSSREQSRSICIFQAPRLKITISLKNSKLLDFRLRLKLNYYFFNKTFLKNNLL